MPTRRHSLLRSAASFVLMPCALVALQQATCAQTAVPFSQSYGQGGVPNTFKINENSALGRLRADRKLFGWPETQSALDTKFDNKAAIDALAASTPLVSQLRQWRDAMRGRGQVLSYSIGGNGFALLADGTSSTQALRIGVKPMGSYSLAGLGAFAQQTPGIELTWKNFAFGTSQPLMLLNKSMARMDAVLDGKANFQPDAVNESTLMWLSMTPLKNKNGQIQMMMVKGRRDLAPWDTQNKKQFVEGQLWGTRGDWKLARWQLSGEWMNSVSDAQNGDKATAWKMSLNGPFKHPLGEMRVNFYMNETDDNFAPFTGNNSNAGYAQTHLDLQQGIAKGKLTGNLSFAYDKTELQAQQAGIALTQGIAPLDRVQRTSMDSTADFRLAISKKMSATARLYHRQGGLSSGNQLVAQTDGTQSSADVGLDWKLSRAMNLSLKAGRSALASSRRLGVEYSEWDRVENRFTVGLNKRTSAGYWALTWQQNSAVGNLGGETDSSNNSLYLEGERKLAHWLRVRGTLRLAGSQDEVRDWGDEQLDSSLEAYLTSRKLGSLSLRLSNWNRSAGAFSEYALQSAVKEQSIRYNTPGDSKIGMSVEYLKRQQRNGKDENLWRVGVSYQKP